MDNSRELLKMAGEGLPGIGDREQHSGIQSVQNLEAVINEGLRVALLEETPDRSLEVLLEYLGKALNGERTYIFEQNESGGDDNTYEWVANGVTPEKDNLQNVPPEVCAGWYRIFYEDKSNDIINDDTLARLVTFPNVLITSHQGYFTTEAMQTIALTTLENARQFETGTQLTHEVII